MVSKSMELTLEYKNRGLYEGQGLQGVNVWIDLLLPNLKQTFVFGWSVVVWGRVTGGRLGEITSLGWLKPSKVD